MPAYSLLCSCSEFQTTINLPYTGGLFSTGIFAIGRNGGNDPVNRTMNIKEIFPHLRNYVETNGGDSSPRLYLGETLIDIPLIKNVNFRIEPEQRYAFAEHLKSVVMVLWNNGSPRELNPAQIRELCGNGAYGNHNKLSLDPWKLVETISGSKIRRLTEKGKMFVQGQIKIPKNIKSVAGGAWVPQPNSPDIGIDEL